MEYHVSKGGVNLGKFTEAHIYRNLANGTFAPSDHYWTPGMPGWKPLSEFRPIAQQPSTPPAPASRPAASTQPQTAARPQPQPSYAHQPHSSQGSGEVSEEKVQLFGYAGAVLLTVGTFGPFMNLGFLSITILQNWNWKGVTILICGLASAAITFSRMYAANWITAGIPSVIFAYFFIEMNGATRGDDLGSAFARSMFSPGWGLFAMCLGIVALGICAGMSSKPMKKLR